MMRTVKIGKVCKISNGFAFKSDKYVSGEGARVIRITNVQKSKIVDNDPKIYPFPELTKLDNYKIYENDILMSLTGNVGRVGKFPKELLPAYINQRVCRIMPKSDDLDANFLFHYLNSDKFENEAIRNSSGAAQLNLSTNWLADHDIPLPPLETQKRIAQILDDAAALRNKTEQLLKEYDALAQAIFLDMFGDPVKNEKNFLKSTVGEHCNVKGGKRVPKGEKLVKENTGYPYIKAGNIKNGKVNTKDLEYLLPTTRDKLKKYTVKQGDVCITVVGVNIGDIGIVPKELHNANLTENANKLLIKNRDLLDSFFLAFYLQMDFIQKDIIKKTMAVGVPKLALFRIEQLVLLLPPIELQNQFAEKITLIEQQKELAKQELKESEDLFNCLLQKAFKGELV